MVDCVRCFDYRDGVPADEQTIECPDCGRVLPDVGQFSGAPVAATIGDGFICKHFNMTPMMLEISNHERTPSEAEMARLVSEYEYDETQARLTCAAIEDAKEYYPLCPALPMTELVVHEAAEEPDTPYKVAQYEGNTAVLALPDGHTCKVPYEGLLQVDHAEAFLLLRRDRELPKFEEEEYGDGE